MNKQQLLDQLKQEGFSKQILNAFSNIKRENFIPQHLKQYAYENQPIPIGQGATISQPYTIAFMLNLLELKDNIKILEIGSGCGYVLALINHITPNSEIYGIEIIKELVDKSQQTLSNNKNIQILHKNGNKGHPSKAPFDRILISASAKEIPTQLYEQLKDNGILVTPVQNSIYQFKKINNKIQTKEFPGFVFVPLVDKNSNI